MSKEEEKERIHKEVVKWIENNDAHFKENCKILYDEKNLERIKRFAGAPVGYLNERLEMNKKVLESYHKLYQSILLAVFSGFFLLSFYEIFIKQIISQLNVELFISTEIKLINNTPPTFWIIVLGAIAWLVLGYFSFRTLKGIRFLKITGLLRVIRDSEIEVYYLSKIKEYRDNLKKPK